MKRHVLALSTISVKAILKERDLEVVFKAASAKHSLLGIKFVVVVSHFPKYSMIIVPDATTPFYIL